MTLKKNPEGIYTSDNEDEVLALKRYRKTKRNGLIVAVRVGSEDFDFQLWKLFRENSYILRLVVTTMAMRSKMRRPSLTIALPPDDFPSGLIIPDVFKVVANFCNDTMKDSDISFTNVARLIVTSQFLEMENLTRTASYFLDCNALSTWQGCLSVLSSFASNVIPKMGGEDSSSDEDISLSQKPRLPQPCEGQSVILEELSASLFYKLFYKCRAAFLDKMERSTSQRSMQSCNLKTLLQVAKILPCDSAELIYGSIVAEKFGLSHGVLSLCERFPTPSVLKSFVEVKYFEHRCSWMVKMMECIQSELSDVSKWSVLVLYLAKFICPVKDRTGDMTIVCFDFLCAILVEITKLVTNSNEKALTKRLREEKTNLGTLVGTFFLACELQDLSSRQRQLEFLLAKFDIDTLLLVVLELRCLKNEQRVSGIAKVLDGCLLAHLKDSSFTVHEVLEIYKVFPNGERSSHCGIFNVMEASLERKELSTSETSTLSTIFDYEKLADEIVERLWGGLLQDFAEPRLRERVVKIRHSETFEELVKLRSDVKAISDGKEQVESELLQLRRAFAEKIEELEKLRSQRSLDWETLSCSGADAEKTGERFAVIGLIKYDVETA